MEATLEERLCVKDIVDHLERHLDLCSKKQINSDMPARALRRIKVFLYKEWICYKDTLKDSILDSRDCVAIAAIANMLAKRKGIDTKIVSPRNLNRFLHAMLVYIKDGKQRVFELTSKQKYNCSYRTLSFDEIYTRLIYTRYLLPFLGIVRPNNHLKYLK